MGRGAAQEPAGAASAAIALAAIPPAAAQAITAQQAAVATTTTAAAAAAVGAAHRSETHRSEERQNVECEKREQGFLYAKRTTKGGSLPEEGASTRTRRDLRKQTPLIELCETRGATSNGPAVK